MGAAPTLPENEDVSAANADPTEDVCDDYDDREAVPDADDFESAKKQGIEAHPDGAVTDSMDVKAAVQDDETKEVNSAQASEHLEGGNDAAKQRTRRHFQ